MIKYITLNKRNFNIVENIEAITGKLLWIDLINPTDEEIIQTEKKYNVNLFTKQESEEIENSSKYIETETEIGINTNFIRLQELDYISEPVSFIIKDKLLISQRKYEYEIFKDVLKKLHINKSKDGDDIFLLLLESRIDFDADLIENITEKISLISKELFKDKQLERKLLLKITTLQETTIGLRENIVEKQRIISAMLKSKIFPKEDYETMIIMIKDVNSLLEYTGFNFQRLEFMQDTFLGLGNMEQNRIIKIFTVVTVIFMPPTLIASMYGMNFKYMPELSKIWGYPFAIIFMILSAIMTLLFFKRKKWL